MKITDIRTFLMHAGAPNLRKWASDGSFGDGRPTRRTSTGTRNWLFVKVYTDEGITGIGECSGWPRVIETAVQDLTRLLIGEDPDPYRAALAEDAHRHHGPRPDRHRRRGRDDRHRHGAVGHQGQEARRARVEPARRQGARPHPHLRPRQHARGGAEPEGARHHRHQDAAASPTPSASSPRCARPSATTWTSPSTCTARHG